MLNFSAFRYSWSSIGLLKAFSLPSGGHILHSSVAFVGVFELVGLRLSCTRSDRLLEGIPSINKNARGAVMCVVTDVGL